MMRRAWLAAGGALATGCAVVSQLPIGWGRPKHSADLANPPLPPPVAGGVRDDGVEAVFNFQHPDVRSLSSNLDASSAPTSSSGALAGSRWDPQRVLVRDGRAASFDLDVHGFAMVQDRKDQHADYYDEADVIDRYYGSCAELVRRATGAQLVLAFDHNVRCDTGKACGRRLRGGNRVEGPAALVHNDYTAASAARRLAMLSGPPTFLKERLRAALGDTSLLSADIGDDALAGRRRFAFVNVWRPIEQIESKPLACVDATTVSGGELVPLTVHHAGQSATGGIYFASHRPEHRWFHFPALTRDEVLLIKQWDSHGGLARGERTDAEEGRATFALHSAFNDPASAPTARDRQSIEVRLLVVY
jgi:hypothetical protein